MSGSKATLTVVDDGWENHVEPTSGFWFEEDVTSDFQFKARLSSIEYQSKSEFQSIQIITKVFKRRKMSNISRRFSYPPQTNHHLVV